MKYEPTRLEIFLTRIVFFLWGKSVYKTFADHLHLDGGEQVLDFGCGMGTVAFYVAKRLPNGKLTCLALAKSLKSGGSLFFREPLNNMERISVIKRLIEQNKLLLKDSRITDIPIVGNTLESKYIK